MDVVRRAGRTNGQILLLGLDEIPMPDAIAPRDGDLLLQVDGPANWMVVAQRPSDWAAFGAEVVRRVPAATVGFRTLPAAGDLREFVRGWRLGGYRFRRSLAEPRKELVLPPAAPDISAVVGQTDATLAARDLVNTPSNTKNPQWMVRQARAVARRAGADIEVLGVPQLRAGGFGGVLAVGAGSGSPPRVAILRRPGDGPRVALIGKGITFDSGGLSIKPREAMTLMKSDMAGAAAVLSALTLAPPGLDVTVLVGFAENAVGGASYRPGDVVTHVDGRTSEIRNTDAEGRLVLADLLAFARRHLDPEVIVDLATLTGAATLALSREMGALYTSTPRLGTALMDAAGASGEQMWPMPLVQSYKAALRSDIADQCHIPVADNVGAGSITAALYLQPFVGDVPWAHLDIAGPARATAAAGLRTLGGTGFGAALLGQWMVAGARH